jgi:hypothetical protein
MDKAREENLRLATYVTRDPRGRKLCLVDRMEVPEEDMILLTSCYKQKKRSGVLLSVRALLLDEFAPDWSFCE